MRRCEYTSLFWALALSCLVNQARAETFGIETLQLQNVEQDWGQPQANRSVDRHPLTLLGKRFGHGLGTHANSTFRIALGGKAERFNATVGVDDEVGQRGSVVFEITGDGKTLWESGVLRGGQPAKEVSVELIGVERLLLVVGDAGDDINYDHADWADARIVMTEGRPEAIAPPREPAVILMPKPSSEPRINGPRVAGLRSGSPFLFTVPASGDRPMTFSATNLPVGLRLDPQSSLITVPWLCGPRGQPLRDGGRAAGHA